MSYSITNNSDFLLEIEFTELNGDKKKIRVPPKKDGNNTRIFEPDESQEIKYTSKGKKPLYLSFKKCKKDGEDHIDGEAGHPGGGL